MSAQDDRDGRFHRAAWIVVVAAQQDVRGGGCAVGVLQREGPGQGSGLGDFFDGIEEFAAAAPKLRVIANCAVGYDNVDISAATRAGIAVTNTPDVLTDATAELTIALMFAAARRLPEGEALVRSGRWEGWRLDQLLGVQIRGRTRWSRTLPVNGCGFGICAPSPPTPRNIRGGRTASGWRCNKKQSSSSRA